MENAHICTHNAKSKLPTVPISLPNSRVSSDFALFESLHWDRTCPAQVQRHRFCYYICADYRCRLPFLRCLQGICSKSVPFCLFYKGFTKQSVNCIPGMRPLFTPMILFGAAFGTRWWNPGLNWPCELRKTAQNLCLTIEHV